MESRAGLRIWSIGHSRHELSEFQALLVGADIQVVADVRSSPYSQIAPWFNQPVLKKALSVEGIQYVDLGSELGGRPEGDEFYDDRGHVFYDLVSRTQLFQEGIQRLIRGATDHNVAVMCSEGSPEKCHRTLLVARVLQLHGLEVVNISPDGSHEIQEDLNPLNPQQPLWGEEDRGDTWRSAVSVRPASPQKSSSRL